MDQHEALEIILKALNNFPNKVAAHGYGVYLPNIISEYIINSENLSKSDPVPPLKIKILSPSFYDAAWELCRIGILRPGVKNSGLYIDDIGAGGGGFCLTAFGYAWISEKNSNDYIPSDPNRYSQMMEPFQSTFGQRYFERAREAIRCYNANAFLACSAMCGASVESILLAAAIKLKSEEEIFKMYAGAKGRNRVETLVFEKGNDYIKRIYPRYTDLIRYWRVEAAHGQPFKIGDDEAYTSMVMLLRFARFMHDHWKDLIGEDRK
jgi:hypothetical protein